MTIPSISLARCIAIVSDNSQVVTRQAIICSTKAVAAKFAEAANLFGFTFEVKSIPASTKLFSGFVGSEYFEFFTVDEIRALPHGDQAADATLTGEGPWSSESFSIRFVGTAWDLAISVLPAVHGNIPPFEVGDFVKIQQFTYVNSSGGTARSRPAKQIPAVAEVTKVWEDGETGWRAAGNVGRTQVFFSDLDLWTGIKPRF